jgi:hypothetical protein
VELSFLLKLNVALKVNAVKTTELKNGSYEAEFKQKKIQL